ncbi:MULTISPECIES: hypothetical protein [Streptomyces]|uniref:hypothetical protein n=1 Tax=Streptomyces TaxID=1883 RepID=UPI0007CD512B|nr:hypothetical protein A4V12_17130 [Streptomyces noursei]
MDDLDLLMDEPGDRLPLLTAGEARAVVALLGYLQDGAELPDAAVWASELQGRLLRRIPTP